MAGWRGLAIRLSCNFERLAVDGREKHAAALRMEPTDEGVNRSDSVTSWLRRAGPGRLLIAPSMALTPIAIPYRLITSVVALMRPIQRDRCHRMRGDVTDPTAMY